MATRTTTAPGYPARLMCSSAAGRIGANRLISKPPTPGRVTILALKWRWRATRGASTATGVNGDQSDNSAEEAGAAYIFVRKGTNWSQQAYLKASNTDANDSFGVSVAVTGDTVVVGAPGEASNAAGVNGNQSDNSAMRSGAAYVFVRSGTNWSQQAYLKASNTGAGDHFGGVVSISGDAIAVSAIFEDSNATGVNGSQTNNLASDSGAV